MSNSKPESVPVSDEDKDFDLSATNSIDLEMNGRTYRQEIYDKAREVMAQTEHFNWKNRRNPMALYAASSSMISSSSDELTIDLNQQNVNCKFNPTEITGRSTATNDASMSVEQILGESSYSDIRALADELTLFKFRESRGGEQLAHSIAHTADVSLTSSKSFRSSMSRPDDWDLNNQIDINGSEFMPSDRVNDFLKNEEARWAQEYATLPPEQDYQSNGMKKPFDLSDFSRGRLGNESENESNASFGQFFNKRSDNLAEMLPNCSPTKDGKPLALVDSVNSTQENLNSGDEMKAGAHSMYLPSTTTVKDGESFINHTAIESFFKKCRDNSPQTVVHNLMKLKKSKPSTQSVQVSAVKPLPEVLYVTEPVPFKPLNTNSNVKILNVEKFYADLAALRERSPNSKIPSRSTYLTPGGHIRKTNSNKENEVDVGHDENIQEQNLSSDTLSMSGLILSASKIQGNSTETSHEDEFINSNTGTANSSHQNNTGNGEITPVNSPQRNRKRTRSICNTPPASQNTLDVLYNRKHRLTPSPIKLDSSPDTPILSKNNLESLINEKHQLTPSPNQSKNGTIQSANSTPVTPVASFHKHHNVYRSTYMDPATGDIRTCDVNLKSPKLLTQSNSQFSSVSDLREFSIKSSQSVISWPSQKLRTPSVKQFTIKNIGGKKLTMKIEVIGPGFQLSPSEPFQLVALQAQECRTISVTFCPTTIGAAIGKLNVCHAKDTADKTIRKIIPLFGYGGHTVVEVQGVSQGVVGNPFLQLGTVGDLLNLQMCGTFSIYNKGPLKGVAIIRVKSDLKKSSGSANYSALTITPAKCVIGPDSQTRIDIVYRPRKNDVKKLLRQEGNVLGVATLEVFMADEPSRQRILQLINKFANNSSEMYLLDDLFRGINTDVVESFAEFQETEEMIGELFNKMKSTEIVLTVKRSTMDQTIESEHDFFMSDTNESMFFHTLVSDDVPPTFTAPPPTFTAPTSSAATVTIGSTLSAVHMPPQRLQRISADTWFLDKTEIKLNPCNVDEAKSQINIYSRSRSQQIFEIYSNYPQMFVIEPDCGVLSPGQVATVNVTIKNTTLPSEGMYIRIRMDKKQDAVVPVIIFK